MALSKPVPQLNSLRVPSPSLEYPEYCFCISVEFEKKLKDDPGVTNLKKILTALLNTSGGILKIRSVDNQKPDAEILDKWKLDLEDILTRFIPYAIYQSCILLLDYTYPLNMCVLKSNKLITVNPHIYVRGFARNTALNEIDSIKDVLTRPSKTLVDDPLEGKEVLKYDDELTTHEGPNVEFKYWKTISTFGDGKNKNTYQFRLHEDRTLRTLLALPNMPNGGYFIIGVEEGKRGNTIQGQRISEKDELLFREFVCNLLAEDASKVPRIWEADGKTPTEGTHWTLKFIPVAGGPAGERRRVIVIKFHHHVGGVLECTPEAYLVTEAGFIEQMSHRQWKRTILSPEMSSQTANTPKLSAHTRSTQTDPPRSTRVHEADDQYSTASKKAELEDVLAVVSADKEKESDNAMKDGTLPSHSPNVVPSPKKPNIFQRTFSKKKSHIQTNKHSDIEGTQLGHPYLSLTEHKQHWDENIDQSSILIDENAIELSNKSKIFQMAFPTIMTPNKDTIIASQTCERTALREVIDYICNESINKSFGIAASQWSGNMLVETEIKRPENHLLDIFMVDETGRIELWAIVNRTTSNYKEIWEYLFISGRVTKRNLLFGQFNGHKIPFVRTTFVECRLVQLGKGEHQSNIQSTIKERAFKPSANQLATLRVCLARILLSKETHIKNIFGDDKSVILTAEQMDVLLELGLDRFNFIEGPPGSGKTYLALHLCQKYNCGYVYTNDTYGKFLQFQKVHRRYKADDPKALECLVSEDAFIGLQYLIIDDSQTFHLPKSTWYRLFEYISSPVVQVKLVILGDSFYQNFMGKNQQEPHDSRQHMVDFCRKNNFNPVVKTLSVIHRNHRKIAAFIKSNFENDSNYPECSQISSSHLEDGDDIDVRYLSNLKSQHSKNGLFEFTQRLTDPQKSMRNDKIAYQPQDVAILVDTQDAADDASKLRSIFRKLLGKSQTVQDAGTFPVTGYTIDILDNFMGLDRRLCILMTSKEIIDSAEQTGRSLANPRYRAFVASRGISRVIFVVDTRPTTTIASSFKLDKLPSLLPKLWHMEETGTVRDLCFLGLGDRLSVLYSSVNDKRETDVRLTSVEHRPRSSSLEGWSMKRVWYTASSFDGLSIILVCMDDRSKGRWCWEVLSSQSGKLEELRTHELDDRPWCVSWTPDGDVLMLLEKIGIVTLARMSPLDGKQQWRHGENVTGFQRPGHIAVCPMSGTIYICDQTCIRELAPDGRHRRDIDTPGISRPAALCVDVTGRTLCLSEYENTDAEDSRNRDVFIMATDGNVPRKLLRAPGRVSILRLHKDGYLAVATWGNGVVLYDIAGAL